MRIEYHRTLIADTVRNEAFFAALKRAIVPGKSVVADVGAGTGLLGVMAAKLGAKDVFLFETGEVAHVARRVIADNRVRNCHLIPCHSTEFADPISADIVVSETLGNYALEENIIDTLNDARKRFLKPGGILIPSRLRQFVAPVVSDRIERELCAWRDVGHGITLSAAEIMSRNNAYVRLFTNADLLDGGKSVAEWDRVDLTKKERARRSGGATWTLDRAAVISGFALWWEADLGISPVLSTAPGAPRTHWEQLYLPLLKPVEAKRGERVEIALKSQSSEAAGTNIAWSVAVKDGKGREIDRQSLDLEKGYLP